MSRPTDYGDIYLIRNIITNKSYVGQVLHWIKCKQTFVQKGWKVRVRNHFSYATNNGAKSHEHPKLYSSIRKYGVKSFVAIKLETCTGVMLNERESWWIKVFDCIEHGYNITHGGQDRRPMDVAKVSAIVTNLWKDKEYRDMQLSKKKRKEKNSGLPHCINPVGTNGVTGYNVLFHRGGVRYSHTFGVSKYGHISLEERLEWAIEWRDLKLEELGEFE
jgi:group I intron endonuclease